MMAQDFADEVAEIVGPRIAETRIVDPDLGFVRALLRRFDADTGASPHEGHGHQVDHGGFVHSGRIRIDWKSKDGRSGSIETGPGQNFTVRKDCEHTITALEDGTSWYCVFTPPEGYEKDLADYWNEVELYV